MSRKLSHGNKEGQKERGTAKGKSDCKAALDALHVGLQNSWKVLGRKDMTQLRSTSLKNIRCDDPWSRLGQISKKSVDKGCLCRRGADSASNCLENCQFDMY